MKILICTDGSEQADRAVALGATTAGACKAEVTVLGIVEAAGESEKVTNSLNRALAILQDLNVKTELITRTGKAIEEIVRILICSGGKPYIENAIQLTGEIARGVEAEVSILHVLPEPPGIYSHLPRMRENAESLLQSHSELGDNLRRARELLEKMNVPAKVQVRCGSVFEQILAEIREQNYELVVTGSALHPTFSTYVLGDITREIVNHAQCAVLVVRSRTGLRRSHFSLRSLLGRPTS
jgi:nucleotide-binding universal stress UspA family protein